jgi:hypothetical protein
VLSRLTYKATAAMTFAYDEEKITFGELLDSLNPAPADAQTT